MALRQTNQTSFENINCKLVFFILLIFLQNVSLYSPCCIPTKIAIKTTLWAEEISWETDPPSEAYFDGIYQDYSYYEHEYCLMPNTTFTFVAKDEYGDGWHGGTYTVFVNGTRILGPKTFRYGHVFAEEEFTTCACNCSTNCGSTHRSCCVDVNQCGQCVSGFIENDHGECVKIDYIASELQAWQKLFNDTNGWNWNSCNFETIYIDPCGSCGVECTIQNDRYTIIALHLSAFGLHGSLPREIGYLTNLIELNLFNNRLYGSIPAEIGSLQKLEYLTIGDNEFEGSIPAEIGNLLELRELWIYSNKLSGTLPDTIFLLSNLEILNLRSNALIGTISSNIGNLTGLIQLVLNSNQFDGQIPVEISNLKELGTFYLNDNQISGIIPPQISQLSNLEYLSFSSNNISGSIPPELCRLENLKWLILSFNQLVGSIPLEILHFKYLEKLQLNSNKLTGGLPREISQLSSLIQLNLAHNNISGEIPSDIRKLKDLQWIILSFNMINGTIPTEISQLHNLQRLELKSNRLSGTIPTEISQLHNLQRLEIESNRLSGTLPPELSQLSSLEFLLLDNNMLEGTIPDEISQINNLTSLSLSFNHFHGVVPWSIGKLQSLRLIDLSHNNFIGSFPTEWNDKYSMYANQNAKNDRQSPFFKELRQFKACCNQFSGHLRNFVNGFLSVSNLILVDLSFNEISGSFNLWFGLWFEYVLYGNVWLKGLSSLTFLDLSFNRIQQQLPATLPSSLSIFFIANNQLTGSIPNSYAQLFIFFSNNNSLKNRQLPNFLIPNDQWVDLIDYDGTGVECQQIATIDGSAKVFDIQPVYDFFNRCRCKPGYFNFQSDSSFNYPFARCEETPPGYYTSQGNKLTKAIPCSMGHFSNRRASTQCDVCTSNTFSLGGEPTCNVCPTKAKCVDGVIGLKQNTWVHPIRVLNESIKDDHIHNCLNSQSCIVNGSNVMCAWKLGYDNSSVLCSECLDGFYSSDRIKKTCNDCTGTVTVISVVMTVIVILIVVAFVTQKLIQAHKFSQSSVSMSIIQTSEEQSDKKGLIRVLVGHIQILVILSGLQLRGPQEFHSAVGVTIGSLIPNFSPATIKCTWNIGFDASVFIVGLTPVILIGLLFLLVICVTLILKGTLKIAIRSMFTVFVFLFYLVHPSVMKQLLEVFHIHKQTIEGEQYLQSDMFITKSSQIYSRLFVVALVGVVVYGLLIPLIACVSLRRQAQKKGEEENGGLSDPIFQSEFGFLYQGYKLDGLLYLWELLIYFRKSLLLLLGVFFGHDAFLQSYLVSIVLIGALTLHIKFHPYRSKQINKVEGQSLGILGVTQICLMMSSYYNLTENRQGWNVLVSVILFIGNGCFIVNIIRWTAWKGIFVSRLLQIGRKRIKAIEELQPKERSDIEAVNIKPINSWSSVIGAGAEMMNMLHKLDENSRDIELYDLELLLTQSCILVIELEKKLDNEIENHKQEKMEAVGVETDPRVDEGRIDNECKGNDAQFDKYQSSVFDMEIIGQRINNLWRKLKNIEKSREKPITIACLKAENIEVRRSQLVQNDSNPLMTENKLSQLSHSKIIEPETK